MANKVMSLHDAVEKYVCDNDVLCLGGFTTNRKPYAAVYEILRQGKTGFVGWSGPAGGDWDALIGEGRVRAYINCYTANSGYTNLVEHIDKTGTEVLVRVYGGPQVSSIREQGAVHPFRCVRSISNRIQRIVFNGIRHPPAFPCRLQHSIIGRFSLNLRVRDGYGCFPEAHRHRNLFCYLFLITQQ